MFMIEMINRGWILRNKIIWQKTNVMPESVKDRFTNDYEEVFFFTKKEKYYDTTIRFINAPLSFLIMLKKEADRLGIETEKISSKQI